MIMTANRLRLIPALVPLLLLMSCGSEQQQPQQQSYKDTKSMVLDVLKTEEAAKAIQKASTLSNNTLQLLSTGEGQQIQLAVKDLLTTENHGVKMLEKTMTDPKFAGDFAKASQKTLKQIQKDLLKDPEYQKNLFEALDNPDYQKIVLETMKSQKYRQQMQEVLRETLQSPLFKAELITMFQRAVQEEMKPKEDQTLIFSGDSGGKSKEGAKKGEGGGEGEGGGQSGGEGEGESGGEGGDSSGGSSEGGGGEDSGEQGQQESESKDKKK
jgi:spore germination protein D